ncbi:MAG: NAD-dependent epimerase/dehydratase family protein [bacterium]
MVSNNLKSIMVTGATGFIGNLVVEYLLSKGFDIIATSKNKAKATGFNWFNKVEYIEFDINSQPNFNLYEHFKKPYKIIHLSWEGLPNYKELFHIDKNLFANYNFLKKLIQGGAKDITVTGTCFEYGLQSGCLSEKKETKPVISYGIAKDILRKLIEEFNKHYVFDFRWIRLFYVYGQNQTGNSILNQLERAIRNGDKIFNMSGGEQIRDYLPIGKMAEYISDIAMQNDVLGIINCCSGEPISIRRLIENYIEKSGADIELNLGYYPYPDYEPLAFWGDNSRLKKILNLFKTK